MNENETHAPCEAYATEVATETASVDNTDARLDEITEALGKLAVQLARIDLRLDLLEGAAGYETEVLENSEHSETAENSENSAEPAPTYEEEEAADPAEEREHYCHGLGKWYTRREWHALIDAINAGEIDYAAYTYKGYKYGYDDRCLNPTPVVNRCNHDGTVQVRVWLAESPAGWSYGMKVKVPGLTFQLPCVRAMEGGFALGSAPDALAMAVDALMRLDEFLPAAGHHTTGLLGRHKSSEACTKAVADYRELVDYLTDTDPADYLTAHNINENE